MQSFSTNNCRSICIALFVIESFSMHLFVYNAFLAVEVMLPAQMLAKHCCKSPSGCTNQAMCPVVASVNRTEWQTNVTNACACVCVSVSSDRQTIWQRSEICRTSRWWQTQEKSEWPQQTCTVLLRNNVTRREFDFLFFLLPNVPNVPVSN